MRYKTISADGHVNEPPNLWVENLPERLRERGPRVIETPKSKGHAWIMEGQQRPSVMGFSSMYFRSSKRFDRASLVEGFKQIKDRGVRYEDLFPGSYDPAAYSLTVYCHIWQVRTECRHLQPTTTGR